jgi:hypothetical protein
LPNVNARRVVVHHFQPRIGRPDPALLIPPLLPIWSYLRSRFLLGRHLSCSFLENERRGPAANRPFPVIAGTTFAGSARKKVTWCSPDLPPRPPFERTQVLTHGTISDLQAFGYDESDIAEGERNAERQKSKERLWRLCRQELYLNDDEAPFATINWRFTLDAIEIASVQGR